MSRPSEWLTIALLMALAAATLGGAPPAMASATPSSATAAAVDSAPAAIDALYGALLEAMRAGPALNDEARYHKLEPVIDRVFDLPLMTQIAVGPRWSSLSADEQRKLVDAFHRFTVATYTNHFDSYAGQRFEVDPTPRPVAGGVLVTTRLIRRDREPMRLDYLMRETNGVSRVIDVYAEGTISEIARRRSEFTDVLSREGADGLIARLIEKAHSLMGAAA